MKPKLTRSGYQSLIQALDGVGINFTKIVLGNGACPANYTTATSLSNPLVEVAITELGAASQNYVSLTGTLSNQGLAAGFAWTEVGIFCSNPNSTPEEPLDDILYAYTHYQLEGKDQAEATISAQGEEIFEIKLTYRIYIGEIEDITATLAESANYASRAELTEHMEDTNNPHHVTAEQLGIDAAFLNGTVNDLEVTYTEPASTANIESGDTISTVFGKISKAIKDLIAHIANKSNPHGVTAAQVGAAAASHNHSAANITSGTLNVARGGTGKASVTTGALIKGAGTGAFTELSGTGAVYATTKNAPAFGTLPASCGGTGNTSVDTTPTANSTKMCTSGGIKTALDAKAASSHNHSADNITSGTLPVARGGIGATTLDPAVGTVGARNIYAGTGAMTAGSTDLTTGRVYLQYI